MPDASPPRFAAHVYDLPLATPFRIAYDTVTMSSNLLVTAERGGLRGHGEAGPVPTITGEDAVGTRERIGGWLTAGAPLPTAWPTDALGLAGSLALQTALLDLEAREAGEPLCTHLRGRPPIDLVTSITLPLEDNGAMVERAERHVAAGYRAFKVKAGGGLAGDLERIRLLREIVGSREIRVDANQGWSRADAARALPVLADLEVAVLEQPLAKSDLEGHAALVAAGTVPIMLDESVFSPADAQAAIAAGAADRINIKLQKAGSITAALAIADVCEAADIPCMVGCMIESRVGILAAAHVAAAHANIQWVDLDGHTFLADDPVRGGGSIEDGVLRMGRGEGLGLASVAAGATIPAVA